MAEYDDVLLARRFLIDSRGVIRYVVENAEVWFPERFRDRDFLQLTRTAWEEVERILMDISERPWSPGEVNRLRNEGLLGAQLHFKLAVFGRYYSDLDRRTSSFSILPRQVKDFFWRTVYRITRKLLKIINGILDSFKEAFPALGVVKEFKDSLENVLEGHDLIEEELNRPD